MVVGGTTDRGDASVMNLDVRVLEGRASSAVEEHSVEEHDAGKNDGAHGKRDSVSFKTRSAGGAWSSLTHRSRIRSDWCTAFR